MAARLNLAPEGWTWLVLLCTMMAGAVSGLVGMLLVGSALPVDVKAAASLAIVLVGIGLGGGAWLAGWLAG